MQLPERAQPVLPRPDAIESRPVEWVAVQEGQPSPVTGFAVTVPGFIDIIGNEAEALRWIREALVRLEEYERRNRESQEKPADE